MEVGANFAGGTSDTMSAASDTNKFHYLYTSATAPANSAMVQAVIVYSQNGGDDHGSCVLGRRLLYHESF